MKRFPAFLGGLLLRLVICILVGVLLLTAVYCIPSEWMAENMEESALVLHAEGLCPVLSPWSTSLLDNFTDSFMLLHAVYRNDQPAVVQAMNIYRPYFEDMYMPYADVIEHYIDGREYINEMTYERYWHGYLVYLKPMLCVINYATMRKLNTIGQAMVFALVIFLLIRNRKKSLILPYILAIGMLNPQVTTQCLQYSSCFYALNFSCIALLLCGGKLENWKHRIFLYTGIFTAFMDYLTYPIATLGIPAVLYFALREPQDWKEELHRLVEACFCWGVGYAGMWGGKWVASGLITGTSQMSGIFAKLQERSVGTVDGREVSLIESWSENWKYFWSTPVTWGILAVFAVVALLLLVRLVQKKLPAARMGQTIPFLLLAAAPFVWYAIAQNHSIMHAMPFTHRTLVVMPFALMCMGMKLLCSKEDTDRIER